MITFSRLRSNLVEDLFPDGEAENLIVPHTNALKEALIDVQRWCDCYQVRHVDSYPQSATYFRSGTTVIDCPKGRVRSVYTVQNGDYDTRIRYRNVSWLEFERWSRRFCELAKASANTGLPSLPLGYSYAGSATDSEFGRSEIGMYCIHGDMMLAAPWIQSIEDLVVEWDGIKRTWSDSDLVADDADLYRALKFFVDSDHQRRFERDSNAYRLSLEEYNAALADLIYECKERKRVQSEQQSIPEDAAHWDSLSTSEKDIASTRDAETDPVLPVSFAAIADFYDNDNSLREGTSNVEKVRDLILASSPSFVLAAGDFSYRHYANYIWPYKGDAQYGTGSPDHQNHFWPALGNHDYDDETTSNLTRWNGLFTLPNNNRYYHVARGPVHLFVVNSDSREPDGRIVDSKQYQYFKGLIGLSTVPWKIVMFHSPPYTSGNHGITDPHGDSAMRWDWDILGVDLVLCGHDHMYERINYKDSTTICTVGTGGNVLYPISWRASIEGDVDYRNGGFTYEAGVTSVVRPFSQSFGALFGHATSTTLKLQFINVDNEVVDSITLTK